MLYSTINIETTLMVISTLAGIFVFGIWYLVFGIWYLVFGIWYLVFGIFVFISIDEDTRNRFVKILKKEDCIWLEWINYIIINEAERKRYCGDIVGGC